MICIYVCMYVCIKMHEFVFSLLGSHSAFNLSPIIDNDDPGIKYKLSGLLPI